MRIFTNEEVTNFEVNSKDLMKKAYSIDSFGVSFKRFKTLAGLKGHIKVLVKDNELIVARKLDTSRYEEVASQNIKEDKKMKITVERSFELGLLDDMGGHMVFGSIMKDIEVSTEFVDWIKEGIFNVERFKEETGYHPENVANIVIDGKWYERQTQIVWVSGYYLKDNTERLYDNPTKEQLEAYKEYRELPKEEEFAMHKDVLRGSDM